MDNRSRAGAEPAGTAGERRRAGGGRLRARDLGRGPVAGRARGDSSASRQAGRDRGAAETCRGRIARDFPTRPVEQAVPRGVPRRFEAPASPLRECQAPKREAPTRRLDRERELAGSGPVANLKPAQRLALRRFEIDLVELEQELIGGPGHRSSAPRHRDARRDRPAPPIAVGERGQRRLERLFAQRSASRIVDAATAGTPASPSSSRGAGSAGRRSCRVSPDHSRSSIAQTERSARSASRRSTQAGRTRRPTGATGPRRRPRRRAA